MAAELRARDKTIVLCLLVAQNAAYALTRRYAQGVLKEHASPSSMLLFGEVIKLALSMYFIKFVPGSTSALPDQPVIVYLMRNSGAMVVPALIYLAMNLLSFMSLQRIDAGTFTLFAQCKLLTTALCSVLFLGRSLPLRQWRALFLMVLGTVLISLSCSCESAQTSSSSHGEWWLGVLAVLVEVFLSGFVSVYFEKVLKTSSLTVWDRNFQLAVYSSIVYLMLHRFQTSSFDLFAGWSFVSMVVALLGALGGILVALCLKYLDSIIKSLCTTGNSVVALGLGYLVMHDVITAQKFIGACVVILSIFNYNEVIVPHVVAKDETV